MGAGRLLGGGGGLNGGWGTSCVSCVFPEGLEGWGVDENRVVGRSSEW